MGWAGGAFTRANGANEWVTDYNNGVGIEPGRHDAQDNDLATGINQCLNKDGSNSMTGNLNLNNNKLTSVGNATVATDAPNVSQVQNGAFTWLGTSAGTSTAYTATAAPAITAYTAGQRFTFRAHVANGVASTIAVNGLAAKTIQRQGTALAGNEFIANDIIEIEYDGTNFQLLNVAPAPLFIDRTNSRIGIGTTTPVAVCDLATNNGGVGASGQTVTIYSNDGSPAEINLRKSRNATIGNNTIVSNADYIGAIRFFGANGSGFSPAAIISATVDGTPGASNDMPGALQFWTTPDGTAAPVQRLTISNAGNIGIQNASPVAALDVSQTVNVSASALQIAHKLAGDVNVPNLVCSKFDNNSTTSQVYVRFYHNNLTTGSGQINGNGASQAAFGTFSDERLKENIINLPNQLQAITALRPVEFDYKDGSGHQIGFIAQEVKTIYPDLVGESLDGFLTISGLGKNEARLIKAIQELNAKVVALEARVAALES